MSSAAAFFLAIFFGMNKHTLRQSLILLITAIIWGTSLVWQSEAGEYVSPFTFNALRFAVGGLVLVPVILIKDKCASEKSGAPLRTLMSGAACGVALFAAAALQQGGITAGVAGGKAGFITALYIVLVPVFSLLLKKAVSRFIWCGVLLAAVGLYFLCIPKGGYSVEYGDILVLLSAVAYAVHILTVDYFVQNTDAVRMSAVQFVTAAFLSAVAAAAFESGNMAELVFAARPIILSGVLSCGAAFTLQTVGQKDFDPTVASLIMSLESLFAVIAGWLLLGEVLTAREGVGCVFMASAVIIAQLPRRKKE